MLRTVIILITATSVDAFSSALFQESPALKTTAPSRYDGVDVELPDFDELFNRIQQVSPLARQIIHGAEPGRTGFSFIDDTCKCLTRTNQINEEEEEGKSPTVQRKSSTMQEKDRRQK